MWIPIDCPYCHRPNLLVDRDQMRKLGLRVSLEGGSKILKKDGAAVSVACSGACLMELGFSENGKHVRRRADGKPNEEIGPHVTELRFGTR